MIFSNDKYLILKITDDIIRSRSLSQGTAYRYLVTYDPKYKGNMSLSTHQSIAFVEAQGIAAQEAQVVAAEAVAAGCCHEFWRFWTFGEDSVEEQILKNSS